MILEKHYKKIIRKDLIKRFEYKKIKDIPEIKRIIISIELVKKKKIEELKGLLLLELLTGEKSEGLRKELKGEKMYNMIYKLKTLIHPLNLNKFDGKGNITYTIKNIKQIPELKEYIRENMENENKIKIIIETTGKKDEESKELLRGLQIKKEKE